MLQKKRYSYPFGIVATGESFSYPDMMNEYSALVENEETRKRFHSKFEEERNRTVKKLAEILDVDENDELFHLDPIRQQLPVRASSPKANRTSKDVERAKRIWLWR